MSMMPATMPDLRKAVLRAMAQHEPPVTKYRLVQMLKGMREGGKDVPSMNVYQFLRDDDPVSIKVEDLGLIFEVLGIGLTLPTPLPHDDRPKRPKKGK